MNLLIVVPSLLRAGAETQAVDLANGLAARGHAVQLLSFEPQLDLKSRVAASVCLLHYSRTRKLDWRLVAALARLIDEQDVQVVLGVMQYAAFLAWLASGISDRKPKVVAAIHTTINRRLKEEIQDRVIYRQMLRRLSATIFVCENQRVHWVARYPELKRTSHVVYNGVDPSAFQRDRFRSEAELLRQRLGVPSHSLVFACIAAFRSEKGQNLLVEAFARAQVGDAYLIFAGDGPCRATVEDQVRKAGFWDRVRFLGSVPDVRPLIVASNVTVLASTAVETFSMAMLESMALGVPMIAPRLGGLSEAIRNNDTGLLFEPGDVRGLVDCLQAAACNRSRLAAMGDAAVSEVARRFTLDQMLIGTEAVLRDVLRV